MCCVDDNHDSDVDDGAHRRMHRRMAATGKKEEEEEEEWSCSNRAHLCAAQYTWRREGEVARAAARLGVERALDTRAQLRA